MLWKQTLVASPRSPFLYLRPRRPQPTGLSLAIRACASFSSSSRIGTRRFINGDTALWMENVSRRATL